MDMKMHSIKVDLGDGFEPIELRALGQINLLCGPNSSGKSTVLRGVNQRFVHGVPLLNFVNESTERFVKSLFSPFPGAGTMPAAETAKRVWLKFEKIANNGRILYADEPEELTQELRSEFLDQWQGQVQFGNKRLEEELFRLLKVAARTCLLPDKRKMVTSVLVQNEPGNEVYDGSSVLHHLFRAKARVSDGSVVKKYELLSESFSEITGGVRFDTEFVDKEVVLLYRFDGGRIVSGNDCGMGLRELLLLMYYATFDHSSLMLIEEPESHIHPSWLRRLIRFLKDKTDKTYILSTHSSSLLNSQAIDRVYVTRFIDNQIVVEDETERAEVLRSLGYAKSDFVISDVLILVEGPHDQEAIDAFLRTYFPEIKLQVAYHILGGDIMDRVPLDHLIEAFDNIYAFVDSEFDRGSKARRRKFKARCDELGIYCKLSDRPTMEHYYSLEAYKAVFRSQVQVEEINIVRPVIEQLGFDPKALSARLASNTKWEYIENTDLGEFIRNVVSITKPNQ